MVRCVLVLRCGLAVVVWYPYAGWSTVVNTSILRSLRLIYWVISWIVLLWFDVCWYYFEVWLGWCGNRMQVESLVLATYLLSYFMGCMALVRCVLVLYCGLAGVVWYPYAGWSTAVNTSILRSLRLICWIISRIVFLWFDVCWCYVVVWLGWCGIRMQVESIVLATYLLSYFMGCMALVRCVLVLYCGLAVVVWYPYAGWSTAVNTSILKSLRLICWVISWVVLLWFDVSCCSYVRHPRCVFYNSLAIYVCVALAVKHNYFYWLYMELTTTTCFGPVLGPSSGCINEALRVS